MAIKTSQLEWCTVRFDNNDLWWVQTVNQGIHWDFDELGLIDPRQLAHILELLDSMREYGLQEDIVEKAFFKFRLEKEMTKQRFRLERTRDSLYDPDHMLFALPNDMDEESGPFEDFMKHALRVRVRMLNDLIETDKPLTTEEIDAEIREAQTKDLLEDQNPHYFTEITAVLEYTPEGLDADDLKEDAVEVDDAAAANDPEIDEGYEEVNEDDEVFRQDKEALNWEQEEDEQQRKRDNPELEDLLEEASEATEEKPKRGRPRKNA